jgi:hypothetical protein
VEGEIDMVRPTASRIALSACVLPFILLAGCKTKEQKAVDQAKAQATATNMPQQVQYVDGNGDTVTDTVQPPTAPGQPAQVSTVILPPAPGPKPHSTEPVVTPLGFPQNQSSAAPTTNANGQPVSAAPGQSPTQPIVSPNQTSNQPAAPISLTVPAGTELAIRINQHISVKTSRAGDHFSGEVVEPVMSNGALVIPRGTPVSGRVDEAHRRGHFKGRSILELRLTSMTLNRYEYPLDTHDNVRTKKGKGRRSAGFIGGMTGAGMLIGGIATGGVGLAIGGAAGAGAGTLIAGTTGNRDIEIPAESIVHFRLADQLVVQNP